MAPFSKKRPRAIREAVCTHCAKACEVGGRAMSVVCPHCNHRLILEDFRITAYYGVREFATCGDILVEKNGHVAARITVGELVVNGEVQGNVIARGRVAVHRTGSLRGDIEAPRLRVESGARLDGFVRIGAPPGDDS
ncbi:MAG: polymer-forming cytoskeletal protein [bacterium]|nr:polymer-forming cytoskeletal protein [bacterium]